MQPPKHSNPQGQPPPLRVTSVSGPERTGRHLLPPLDDPAEAMKFCRALAAAMDCVSDAEEWRLQPAHMAALMAQADESLPPPMLSIVIPVFNEAENLPTLHARLTDALNRLGFDYEIVLVDDGSMDQSPEILKRLESEDRRVVLVRVRQKLRASSRHQRRARA